MNRRVFLTTMGIGPLAAPLAAEAQQDGKTYRIGWLGDTPSGDPANTAAFQQSLRDLGWVEGQNIVFERRYSEGRNERLPSLAAELVRLKPDLIITTGGTPSAAAAKQATTTIPIVFCYVGDPVASGFVASLSRPGGNLTGVGAPSTINASVPALDAALHEGGAVTCLLSPQRGQGEWFKSGTLVDFLYALIEACQAPCPTAAWNSQSL